MTSAGRRGRGPAVPAALAVGGTLAGAVRAMRAVLGAVAAGAVVISVLQPFAGNRPRRRRAG
jgi:hypothetical protein